MTTSAMAGNVPNALEADSANRSSSSIAAGAMPIELLGGEF